MSEEKVASCGWLVAGEAGFVLRLVGGFAVLNEWGERPAACRGVFLRVLDHDLKVPIGCGPGNEGLVAAKDFVVFLRRDITPSQPDDDSAVGERQRPCPIGFDGCVVA